MFTLNSDKDQRKKFPFLYTFAQCKWTLNMKTFSMDKAGVELQSDSWQS